MVHLLIKISQEAGKVSGRMKESELQIIVAFTMVFFPLLFCYFSNLDAAVKQTIADLRVLL